MSIKPRDEPEVPNDGCPDLYIGWDLPASARSQPDSSRRLSLRTSTTVMRLILSRLPLFATPASLTRWSLSCGLALAIAGMLSPNLTAESWNGWRGPDRTGQTVTALPQSLEGLGLQWERDLGPSYSGPVVQDGLVFSTETVHKKTERVSAHRLSDGSLVWQTDWEGSMAVPFFAAANGDWIRSTPAVVDGHLVVFGMRDVLVDLDPSTGNENWRVDLPAKLGAPLEMFGAVCSPLIDGNAVYLQSGGGLLKLSLDDGSILWTSLPDEGGMSGGAFSSPVIATIAGTRQLVVQTRTKLCGVNLETGKALWQQPIEAFRGMNILTPTVIGDAVFTAAHSGSSELYDVSNNGEAWSVALRWQQKGQGYMSSPVVVDGHIYLHQRNERLTCLSVADGSITWTGRPIGKYASMITDGKTIACLTADGTLRLIDADPTELRVLGEASVAEDSWAHLAMVDGGWIVRDLNALKVYDWKSP